MCLVKFFRARVLACFIRLPLVDYLSNSEFANSDAVDGTGWVSMEGDAENEWQRRRERNQIKLLQGMSASSYSEFDAAGMWGICTTHHGVHAIYNL